MKVTYAKASYPLKTLDHDSGDSEEESLRSTEGRSISSDIDNGDDLIKNRNDADHDCNDFAIERTPHRSDPIRIKKDISPKQKKRSSYEKLQSLRAEDGSFGGANITPIPNSPGSIALRKRY